MVTAKKLPRRFSGVLRTLRLDRRKRGLQHECSLKHGAVAVAGENPCHKYLPTASQMIKYILE